MKKFFNEFKEFAVKGNMIDIAVGMIVGAAFTAVVTSLVNDIFMPLLGLLTAGFVDFSTLGFTINKVFVPVGNLLNAIINFIAIALVVFLMVKGINKLRDMGKKKEEEAPAAPTTKICPFCRTEIAKEACKCPNCTSDLPAEE